MADIVLYSTNFSNSGSFPSGWSTNGDWIIDNDASYLPNSSGYSAASGGYKAVYIDAGISPSYLTYNATLSTVGYSNIRLFCGAVSSSGLLVINDIEYSVNGTVWTSIGQGVTAGPTWTENTISLPVGASNVSNLRFRFYIDNGAISEFVAVDDIQIIGFTPFNIAWAPQQYTPAYNEIIFVTSGTNNIRDNYKYICDIYFPGSTSYEHRLKVSPRSDGHGVFDLHTILKDYVSSDIAIQTTGNEGFKTNGNSYKSFIPWFGEEFGTTPVVYPNLATSGTYYAYNASLEHNEFVDYNQTSYKIRTGSQVKFLTNRQSSTSPDFTKADTIGSGESAWVYMFTDTALAINTMQIRTFNSSQAALGVYTVANPFKSLSTEASRFLRFPSGPVNIAKIPSSSISVFSGSLPIISASVSYYWMTVQSSAPANVTEVYMYAINDTCTKYTRYNLHFLNKLGGFDPFSFSLLSRTNTQIDRKSYKKVYGTLSSTGAWSYSKKDRGIINFSTKYKDKITLNSDWISEAKAEQLLELLTSPEIFWDNNDELIAVNITNSSYEKKLVANDKLINVQIEIELTQDSKRQAY